MQKLDLSIDWLADAPLTPDQRRAWNFLRGELATTQAKNQELVEKVRIQDHPNGENEPVILTNADFTREVARMLAYNERYGGLSSLIYFEFSHIEETAIRYGRSVANAALRDIGALLMRCVRGSDIVGRLGPQAFAILLMRCDGDAASRKAEILVKALQQTLIEIHNCKLDIPVVSGAYTFREKEDLSAGLRQVMAAAHQAK